MGGVVSLIFGGGGGGATFLTVSNEQKGMNEMQLNPRCALHMHGKNTNETKQIHFATARQSERQGKSKPATNCANKRQLFTTIDNSLLVSFAGFVSEALPTEEVMNNQHFFQAAESNKCANLTLRSTKSAYGSQVCPQLWYVAFNSAGAVCFNQ